MKRRVLILSVVVAALGTLAVAPMVFGGPGGRFGRHGMGPEFGGHGFAEGFILGRLAHVRDALDLSDAQVEQIRTIAADLREQNQPYREAMRDGIHDAAGVLLANPNDVAGAQAKLDAQAAAEKALKANTLTAVSKALNVLTPEQRVKLGELMEQHAARRQKRFGR